MTPMRGAPAARVVVGLAGTVLEGPLVHALQDEGAEVERCLFGDALFATAQASPTAAVVVEEALNRLTPSIVRGLVHAGLPVYVLASAARRSEWETLAATALPPDIPVEELARLILKDVQARPVPRLPSNGRHNAVDHEPDQDAAEPDAERATVIAVTAVDGGVGCTTVSINIAAALGACADTILIDADFTHPCIAAYLAADVLRSLAVLTRDTPAGTEAWGRALAAELQPLDEQVPRARLLLGVPKPEPASALTPRLLAGALAAVPSRTRYLVLDLGADSLGEDTAAQRTALARADHVLLVARGDAVSLWQARSAAERWRGEAGLAPERLALVVNRHDRRLHQTPASIAWATRLPIAAVIPEDHHQAQLAVIAQRPLVLQRRGRAAKALLDLADRVAADQIGRLPPTDRARRRWPLPWCRPAKQPGREMTDGATAIAG